MSRKFFRVALFAVLAMSLMAIVAEAAPWKIAHLRPSGSEIDKELTWFTDEVRKATDGRVDIQIYGNSQLGDYTVVQERVSLGAVEMSCQSISPQVDKKMLAGTLQYVVFDYEGAKKNYSSGAKFTDYISKLFEKQGIKVLAWWPVYFGGIGLTKEPADPTNPDGTQNCKVRVPAMKTWEVMANALGYQATPLPFSEFFTAAQTGMVDGIFGGGAENYFVTFKDLMKCYIVANTHFEIWPMVVNAEAFESLSDADKEVLQAKAKEFEERRWVKAPQDQDYYVELLEKNGTKIIRLTAEQLKAFAEKTRAVSFSEFKKIIGDAAYEEIFQAYDLQ